MDDLIGEAGKGFLRVLGYILAEVFFGTVCYWVGWPVCKTVTFGRYPSSKKVVYLEDYGGRHDGFWCSVAGLFVLIFLGLYLAGQI